MKDLSKLERIALDQLKTFKNKGLGVERNIDFSKYLKTNQITVISGIRRSGKSTLLAQFSKKTGQYYYVNFDDERLMDFKTDDFDDLMIVFRKMFSARTIFIDEVQNVEKWELFVRRLYEEEYKVFITGSNAKLLSSEFATRLSGRYFKIELYPFSFKEYLNFKNANYKDHSSDARSAVLREWGQYLKNGGFPEYVKYKDDEFVKRIYEDIIYRDLLVRFKIKETKNFKQLANYMLSNFTHNISYRSLKNTLGFKSITSVKNYIDFMQESFLVFELFKYDYSLKKQYVSDKKIYCIDNGLRNAVAFSFSGDAGKMLENAVFIELKRRGKEIYYYKDKHEADFIIKEKNKIVSVLQITSQFNERNEKRELGGLLGAMEEFKLKKGFIITDSEEDRRRINGMMIEIVPAWKWFLEQE